LLLAVDGVRDGAVLSYRIKGEKMKAASLFMPSWASPLLPTEMDITFKGVGLNLDGAARKALAAFDPNRDPAIPVAVSDEIARDFEAGHPRILLSKSTIGNEATTISGEGEITFEGGKPAFAGTFEATGYDKIIEALQKGSSDNPDLVNAVLGAQMAKGMAKTLTDGRLQWTVEARPDGSIAINGTTIKQPEPPEEITPELTP